MSEHEEKIYTNYRERKENGKEWNTLVASFSVNVGRSTYVSNEQNRLGGSRLITKRSGYLNASEHPDSQKP